LLAMKVLVVLGCMCWVGGIAQPTQSTQGGFCDLKPSNNPGKATVADLVGVDMFGLDLFKDVAKNIPATQNMFMSPLSVWSMLSIALLGAKGVAKEELERVLRLPSTKQGVYKTQANLNKLLNELGAGEGNKPEVRNFNKAFFSNKIVLKDCVEKSFDNIEVRDFSNSGELAIKINGEVSKVTKGVIKDFLKPTDLNRAVFVLVNAIYFKGFWETQFDSRFTSEWDFKDVNNKKISKVQMMVEETDFKNGFAKELRAEVVELPYANSNISMVLLLPGSRHSLSGPQQDTELAPTLAALNPASLEKALKELHLSNLQIAVPKFKIEKSTDVKPSLNTLGLKTLMTGQGSLSDFSGENLVLSDIIHKAAITVDETGTEAAAVTGGITLLSLPPSVHFNRPFIFLIHDKNLKITLFTGIINNPAAVE